MRKCPRCRTHPELKPVMIPGRIEVDLCGECRGMYFDKGEMGRYLQLSKDVPNYKKLLEEAPESVECPGCGARMKEIPYVPGKDLKVDVCTACGGVWMDAGEIGRAKEIADAQEDMKIRAMRAIWEMRRELHGETFEMTCPKCGTPTVHDFNTSEGVVLDMCDRCKGVWFDKGEIARYAELSSDLPDAEQALKSARPTPYKCPKCSEGLVEIEYSAIELPSGKLLVEYCKACGGFWFDGGEVGKLETLSTLVESPASRLGRAVKEMEELGFLVKK